MILAMLITWSVEGYPILPSMNPDQSVAYISDVGAFGLKPLFITGSVITTVFLDIGFAAERWLRHRGKLIRNTSTSQKVLSVIGIIFGIAGSAGLILLSIFDDYHHPRLHDGFLLLFLGGYVISAIFLCAEYQRLGLQFRNHRILRFSFWTKLFFIVVEVALAIVFVVTHFTNTNNIAAGFEWAIAFIFTFYILSFLLDLLPAVKTKHHVPQGLQELEKGPDGESEGNFTNDSAGPNQDDGYRGTARRNF